MIFDLILMETHRAVRLGIFAALCILVVYLIMIVTGKNGLLDLSKKRAHLKALTEKNQRLEQKNVDLYRVIDRMKHDPAYIEDLARRELKMIGKDEVIYKFKDETEPEKPAEKKDEGTKDDGRGKNRSGKHGPFKN